MEQTNQNPPRNKAFLYMTWEQLSKLPCELIWQTLAQKFGRVSVIGDSYHVYIPPRSIRHLEFTAKDLNEATQQICRYFDSFYSGFTIEATDLGLLPCKLGKLRKTYASDMDVY